MKSTTTAELLKGHACYSDKRYTIYLQTSIVVQRLAQCLRALSNDCVKVRVLVEVSQQTS
jgi:hypothetical protein